MFSVCFVCLFACFFVECVCVCMSVMSVCAGDTSVHNKKYHYNIHYTFAYLREQTIYKL